MSTEFECFFCIQIITKEFKILKHSEVKENQIMIENVQQKIKFSENKRVHQIPLSHLLCGIPKNMVSVPSGARVNGFPGSQGVAHMEDGIV